MQNQSHSISRKHRCQAVVELSNHEVAEKTRKQKPWPNAETIEPPAKTVRTNYEETTIA